MRKRDAGGEREASVARTCDFASPTQTRPHRGAVVRVRSRGAIATDGGPAMRSSRGERATGAARPRLSPRPASSRSAPSGTSTILPFWRPASMSAYAAGACESGKTLSTRGLSRPAATARSSARNSRSFAIVDPRIESCFQNRRRISSLGLGPEVAPQVTMRPPLAAALSELIQVASPTVSTTTSTPRLSVWRADRLRHVLGGVVDDELRAGLAGPTRLLGSRRRREHARAGRAARSPARRPRRRRPRRE